jgi:hypothetical protein
MFIYNTYRGISTVKSFASPNQPGTLKQANAKARLTTTTRAWAGLSSAERAQWTTYADNHTESDWTGNQKRLTGHNMFCRINTRILLAGGSAIDTPSAAAAPGLPAGLTMACPGGAGTPIIATYSSAIGANISRVFYMVGPISTGRSPKFEQASIVDQLTSADASPQNLVAAPAAGQWQFWVEDIDKTTGLVSAQSVFNIVVA